MEYEYNIVKYWRSLDKEIRSFLNQVSNRTKEFDADRLLHSGILFRQPFIDGISNLARFVIADEDDIESEISRMHSNGDYQKLL